MFTKIERLQINRPEKLNSHGDWADLGGGRWEWYAYDTTGYVENAISIAATWVIVALGGAAIVGFHFL
jgi:hypothetical protein